MIQNIFYKVNDEGKLKHNERNKNLFSYFSVISPTWKFDSNTFQLIFNRDKMNIGVNIC